MQARLPSQVSAVGMACFCNASNAHILQRIGTGMTFERLFLLQLVRDIRCQLSDHKFLLFLITRGANSDVSVDRRVQGDPFSMTASSLRMGKSRRKPSKPSDRCFNVQTNKHFSTSSNHRAQRYSFSLSIECQQPYPLQDNDALPVPYRQAFPKTWL
jgi:hypothetical protein